MRVTAILGAGAELDAGCVLRAARADGIVAYGARLAAPVDASLPEDRLAFVAAHGALWPNEAFWLEWGSGTALEPELPADGELLVVACPDPAQLLDGFAGEKRRAAYHSVDRFGRPLPQRRRGAALPIGLLGGTRRPEAYLAVRVALGDAADRLGLAIEPIILPAEAALPAGLAGLVLPGGSALSTVPAQCAAAAHAADAGLPVLGLCLGMQSMATALIRAAGHPSATLEEIAGPGAERSFVRLRDAQGCEHHRLGEVRLVPLSGSRLAALLPDGVMVRMNHRYRLAAEMPLPAAAILHCGPEGIAEAIELPAHPFFIGLQGHPELGCDPALARLWDGFLAAVANHS